MRSEETRAASLGAAVVVGLVNGGIKDAANFFGHMAVP